jgi:hypothetical protein
MSDSFRALVFALGFFTLWIVLNKWVLPYFGVKT